MQHVWISKKIHSKNTIANLKSRLNTAYNTKNKLNPPNLVSPTALRQKPSDYTATYFKKSYNAEHQLKPSNNQQLEQTTPLKTDH
jgi:hypothetical protein